MSAHCCGATAAKLGWLSENAVEGIIAFAVKFAAPSLLFLSISRLDISTTFQWPLIASFCIAAAVSFSLPACSRVCSSCAKLVTHQSRQMCITIYKNGH